MNKKKIKNRIHTKQRAKERFDLTLNRKDYQNIVLMILNKEYVEKFTLKKSGDGTYSGYVVNYSEKLLPVVFNNRERTVVTVLPDTDKRIDISEAKIIQININNKEFLQQKFSTIQKRFNISPSLSVVEVARNKYYISGSKKRKYLDNKLRSAVDMIKYFKFIEKMELELINQSKLASTSTQPLADEKT